MRTWALIALLVFPSTVHAQGADSAAPHPDVRALALAVPRVRGKRSHGRSRMTKSLRRALSRSFDAVPKPSRFARAQRKLPRRRRTTPAGLAEAGRRSGVDYVLDVSITRKGWLYTARALLVRSSDGLIQMDFRSQYYKPTAEAADRGRRIANRVLQKLETLRQDGLLPAPASPPPPVAAAPSTPTPPEPAPTPTEPARRPSPEVDPILDPTALVEPTPSGVTLAEPATPPPAPPSNAVKLDDADDRSAEAAVATRVEAPPANSRRWLHLSLAAGAGLVRSYTLESAAGRSGLSHALDPLALLELRARARFASLAVEVRSALRPVQYRLTGVDGLTATPGGLLVDGRITAGWAIDLSSTWTLVPGIGARLHTASIDAHAGPIIVDLTTVSTLLAVSATGQLTSWLELRLGAEGGLLLGVSESPARSGDPGVGVAVGADVGLRLWLSDSLALALDNRFVYEGVDFSGEGDRAVPPGEASLQEASLDIRDLRTALGAELRF